MKTRKIILSALFMMLLSIAYVHFSCEAAPDNQENDLNNECAIDMCVSNSGISYEEIDALVRPEKLLKSGPVNYLKLLKQINCNNVSIPNCRFPQDKWVTKMQFDTLIALLHDSSQCAALKIPTPTSYTENLDSAYVRSSTVGTESLRLLNGLILNRYPCNIKFNTAWIESRKDSLSATIMFR